MQHGHTGGPRPCATSRPHIESGIRAHVCHDSKRPVQSRRGSMSPKAWGLAFLTLAALASSAAGAEPSFPSRPIRLLVTIPPGGAPDISARLVGQYLHET